MGHVNFISRGLGGVNMCNVVPFFFLDLCIFVYMVAADETE